RPRSTGSRPAAWWSPTPSPRSARRPWSAAPSRRPLCPAAWFMILVDRWQSLAPISHDHESRFLAVRNRRSAGVRGGGSREAAGQEGRDGVGSKAHRAWPTGRETGEALGLDERTERHLLGHHALDDVTDAVAGEEVLPAHMVHLPPFTSCVPHFS